jgi:Protein of unknown function (DUF1353)
MPFVGDVVVTEISNDGWRLVEPLMYEGKAERFVVEKGFQTDFASVPKIFTWLLPRYGRYTKAAILHDWLCQRAKKGLIDRADADGIFLRSMRELGVPFLRRWLMWGAVRLASIREFGLGDLLRPTAGDLVWLLVVTLFGLAYLIVPGIVIIAALLVFYAAEWITWAILQIGRRAPRPARRRAALPKRINRPKFAPMH